MEFSQLVERAVAVRAQYAEVERRNYGAAWTNEELALGFVGDVGDLVKLVMAQSGRRDIPDAKAKLAHELADFSGRRWCWRTFTRLTLNAPFCKRWMNWSNTLHKHAGEWLAITVMAIVALPLGYFAFLVAAVVVYLALVEVVKRRLIARLLM